MNTIDHNLIGGFLGVVVFAASLFTWVRSARLAAVLKRAQSAVFGKRVASRVATSSNLRWAAGPGLLLGVMIIFALSGSFA